MRPTIGRIIHYKDAQGIVWPAIITAVEDKALTLTVFDNSQTTAGVVSNIMAGGLGEAESGQWWWPKRV